MVRYTVVTVPQGIDPAHHRAFFLSGESSTSHTLTVPLSNLNIPPNPVDVIVRQSQQQVDSISMSNGNLVVKFHQHLPFEGGGQLLVQFIYVG